MLNYYIIENKQQLEKNNDNDIKKFVEIRVIRELTFINMQ